MRVRVLFAKTDAMRFTGHLDLFRTWERSIRRAGLPLAYTQGFRPHPRLNLASALPLGFTSDCELIDIWLDNELPLLEIKSALIQAAPPGIAIFGLESEEANSPALQTLLEASEYLITIAEYIPELDQRVQSIVSGNSLIRHRRGKDYDLRSLIHSLEIRPTNESGYQQLIVCLSAKENATGRPEEVILALGGNPQASRFHRSRLVFN